MCLDSVQIPCQSMILCCFIYTLRATDFGVCGRRGYPGTSRLQSMILNVLSSEVFVCADICTEIRKAFGGNYVAHM